MPSAQTLAVAVLLAVFCNGMVEYLFKTALDKAGVDSWWLMYISLLVGVAVAVVFRINLFVGIGISNGLQEQLAIVMSGLVIGRGANYIADLPWLKPSGTLDKL